MKAERSPTTQTWQARLAAEDKSLHIHLLGIGGAGLSAIARVLIEQGFQVSGSDRRSSTITEQLGSLGAQIFTEQVATNLTNLPAQDRPAVVLISSAVDAANPERQAAEALGIPVVKRDEFLKVLLARRQVIAVAGTAGKTTTTAMIVQTLREGGIDAGYIIGSETPGLGSAAAGSHPLFVVEADEYDHMFLGLRPVIAVITNVVWDHPDCYPSPESFWQAFKQFTDLTPWDGLAVSCADDAGAERLYGARKPFGPCWVTYGLAEHADVQATNLLVADGEQHANLVWWRTPKGQLTLQTPGAHNVRNALAALTVAIWCGVSFQKALTGLKRFAGATRRFEHKGSASGVTVIDDYAHHPTKVQATLAAARDRYPKQRIWAVLQPHTFSRTKHLLAEFAASFGNADRVIITDIYAAREPDDGSVQAQDIVNASAHPHMQHIGGLTEAAEYLAAQVEAGDVVVVMGAGDSSKIGEMVLEKLERNV